MKDTKRIKQLISKLPKDKQSMYIDKITSKDDEKELVDVDSKILLQEITSLLRITNKHAKITHTELIDNDKDVHPQYLNKDRLGIELIPINQRFGQLSSEVERDFKKVVTFLTDTKKHTRTFREELTKSLELLSRNINEVNTLKSEVTKLAENDKADIELADQTRSNIDEFLTQLQVVKLKLQILETAPELRFESDNIDISDKVKNGKRIINLHAHGGGEKVTVINAPGGGGSVVNPFDYPSQAGKAGQYLSTNGTTVSWTPVAGASGGLAPFTVTTYTSNTNLSAIRQVARADTSGASITLTLPGASANTGLEVMIKKIVDDNALTIKSLNSEFIDGVTLIPVYVGNVNLEFVSNGNGWDIL